MELVLDRKNEKPDYASEIRESRKEFERGVYKADKLPVLIKVNEQEALGVEPGYNVIHSLEKEPRPGVVVWYDNGIEYHLYGPLSLRELITIAESAY